MTRLLKKEDHMKTRLAAAAALLALSLVCACGPAVEPGDGPAATAEPSEPTEPAIDHGQDPTPQEDEPTKAEPKVATFKDKYVYDDGLEVEVIKVVNGKFTRKEVEYSDEEGEKYGAPYTKFTVRVRNGSKETVDLSASATVTYGPDGTEAGKSYILDDDSGLEGKLLPGRSRSSSGWYLVPTKWRGDVVLEFAPDYDHESAVFAGSTL